jgi:ribosomal protein L11 methylase PrmA
MLVTAGISAPSEPQTRDAFMRAGLKLRDRTQRDDWVALALVR